VRQIRILAWHEDRKETASQSALYCPGQVDVSFAIAGQKRFTVPVAGAPELQERIIVPIENSLHGFLLISRPGRGG
jgi:hypothetical protein